MLTDFQKRKLTRAFHFADLDHDGYLEREDFELYAQKMAHAFDLKTNSATYEQLHKQMIASWEQQKAIAGGKERVTLESWLAFYDLLLSSPQDVDKYANGYVDGTLAMWRMLDPNGPADTATLDRYQRFYTAFGLTKAQAEENFRRMDTNGDGKMDRGEMIKALSEFFGSNDPNAPGNHFLGPY